MGNRGWITSSLFETKGHKVRLQERERNSRTSKFSPLSAALAVGLFESAVQSAALRDLSIHLLWLRSNAPNNTPFLFYSTSLSLCWVAQQNYVPNDNYQSKLWSEKWRQRKLLTRTSSMNRTPKRSSVIREWERESWEKARREGVQCKPSWFQSTYSNKLCQTLYCEELTISDHKYYKNIHLFNYSFELSDIVKCLLTLAVNKKGTSEKCVPERK